MSLRSVRYFFLNRLIGLIYYVLRAYLSLMRVRVVGEEIALGCLSDYERLVVAVWHQRFLPSLAYVTKFRYFKPIVMISQSKDGELAARIAQRLGLVTVRGSSSKGGETALVAITKALRDNPAVIHIVDGPRGPKGVVKPGLITMAQVSGAVVIPVTVSAGKAWVAGSWDRFLIPKPFSEVTIEWGRPFAVPRDLDAEESEDLRQDIEDYLTDEHAAADRHLGWESPL